METLTPQLVAVLSLTGGVAFAMVVLGRSYSMLERPSRRWCPSCGRLVGRRARCGCWD